ncbi:steroid 17-alpha-hydroxylase/17,20 lyase-like isoform X1 [Dermacentor albipictus]|uniref:steroid 17-alpha-hydroxylase/17,20 lyase-like isoform X1 n=2 Tax=Dermacentor albipictus TaxID=60249 RepID=UPI0031FD5D4E
MGFMLVLQPLGMAASTECGALIRLSSLCRGADMTVLGDFSSPVDWRWITTALVFVVTYLVGRFYHRVSNYPKGPFPLPLVGNLLTLRNANNLHSKSAEWSKTYGDVFTMWMAHRPVVMLNSHSAIREAFVERRHDFAGRFPTRMAALQNQGDHDIMFEDYNPRWKALRKLAWSAVRKYAVSESLGKLCTDIVDTFVESLNERPQIMDSRKPILSILCKVIGVSIYGTRLREEMGEVEQLENFNRRFHEICPNGLPSDIAPYLAFLYIKRERKIADLFYKSKETLRRLFTKAEAAYIPGNTENFTHAMLTAREEAIKEDKDDAQYLTKDNMILITINLFNAGVDTSTGTLQWLLLRMAKEPGIQARIQKEIEENIGNVPPVHGDREKLPFTVACLLETLRMHPAAPVGLPHNTTTNTRVGKWDIPKDTALMYNIYGVHHDPSNWEKPEEFRPERFLDPVTGKVRTDAGPLITFGMGPRICPGEKLAHMDMFYILVRLMQRLSCSVPDGLSAVNLKGNDSSLFVHPAQQNIAFTRRN